MTSTTSSPPWKEHFLDEIPVSDSDLGDAVTCVLHTILFTRAPGPVRPSEASCHAFPNITYSLCAVGDVSRKVEHAVKAFEDTIMGNAVHELDDIGPYGGSSASTGGGYYAQRSSLGSSQRPRSSLGHTRSMGPTTGYLVVAFFERKVKKALFGLMSNEEKIYFEKWIIPVTVSAAPPSPTEQDAVTRETETMLQSGLLHILSAVQMIDHIPNAMYDFEILQYSSLEAVQSDGSYGLGLGGSGSVRLMP
ncbi:hypothetical protein Poli38472_007979 [Pythium oligandrum]|uniref:Autophagy-related protein 101 n=1 Tax=Pythium oligandrum TaxID=41045 RepID=A0A8K1CMZ7_PYTOL|nr:hypothetical protein Poli38472_007979 [Pythium oligandrum]|eukprot:TMW65337.1 hypothetical protein Poli38472_007979 [Pythium oligandrum]